MKDENILRSCFLPIFYDNFKNDDVILKSSVLFGLANCIPELSDYLEVEKLLKNVIRGFSTWPMNKDLLQSISFIFVNAC